MKLEIADIPRLALVLVLAAWIVGCEKTETTIVQPPATGPVSISAAGGCRVDGSSTIACEDRSSTIPANSILSISFDVYLGGVLKETKTVNPGSQTPRPTSFSGLPNGSYEVVHTIRATDGGSAERIYRPLVVN
jgi:hypothetical protein